MLWTTSQTWIRGSALVIAASLWIGFGLMEWDAYQTRLGKAVWGVEMIARMEEENALRMLEPARILLDAAAADARTRPITPQWARNWIAPADRIAHAAGMVVLDTAGQIIAASTGPAHDDFSDREFFQAHRDGAEIYLGRVIASRLGFRHVFTLSRRLAHADGHFAGVAVIGIRLNGFEDFQRSLSPEQGRIALMSDDGRLILGEAPPPASTKALFVTSRRLKDLPVSVAASRPWSAMIAGWQSDFAVKLAVIALATALVLGLLELAHQHAARVVDFSSELATLVRKLDAANAASDHTNRKMGRLIATLSHDLLQPQVAGRLFMTLARDMVGGEAARLIEQALNASELEADLLEHHLQYALLNSGQLEPRFEPVPLGALIHTIACIYGPTATAAGIDLRMVPNSALVWSDPRLLHRIVANLASNAIGHSEAKRILIGGRRHRGGIQLLIRDDGKGLPRAALRWLWLSGSALPSHRMDGRDPENPHAGIGIEVILELASLLGHPISVKTEPGRGTAFMLHLGTAELHTKV